MNNPFSILVLDDNPVFLKAFHYRLSTHAQSLEVLWDCKVEVNACSTTVDFFKSLAQEPNFLILDYKLGNGLQADLLLKLIRGKGVSADSVIISEGSPKFTDSEKQQQQISAVLRKDSLLVPRSCIMIEERLFRHINQI